LKDNITLIKQEQFDFEKIELYFRNKDNSSCFQVISDRTCNDLDLNDLFIFLDRTQSKIGQQVFYNALRTISHDCEMAIEQEQRIEWFLNNTSEHNKVASRLKKLNSEEAYQIAALFQNKHTAPPKWHWVIQALSCISLLSICLCFYSSTFLIISTILFLCNLAIHYWNKKNVYQYAAAIPQLLKMNHVAKLLLKSDRLTKDKTAIQNAINEINKVKNRMWLFRLEAKLDSDAVLIFWGIIEIVKIGFLLEPILLFNVLNRLDKIRNSTEKIFEYVGTTDMAISIGLIRKEVPYFCTPVYKCQNTMVAKDIYHPLIESCHPNSINCSNGSALFTGSNMSGKTSFIRTIGLNAITAMTINTCFANTFVLAKAKILTSIRISDDLINSKSYYFEEVTTIKSFLDYNESDSPCIFLIDEPFKGTNTRERIAAGKAILSALAERNLAFATTHDMELTELLMNEYQLFHFCESIVGDQITFDYQLKPGPVNSTNALRILKINGYPNEVVDEAKRIAEALNAAKVINGSGLVRVQ
jgi:hypothetical protein